MLNRFGSFHRYIEQLDFEGFDLFDGLNSRFLKATPLYKSEFVRLCWIQLFKRSPVNLRPLFGVPKGFNAKGGALFLQSYLKRLKDHPADAAQQQCFDLLARLRACVIQREQGIAWGYNFDWQARAFYVPQGTPNVVTTVFVGNALLDYYNEFPDQSVKEDIANIKAFILNEMILWENDQKLCFAYIPGQEAEVHNANLLTAAFLSRAATLLNETELHELALKAVRFSLTDITIEGYWPYGTRSHHRWMDNFHTAFNLQSLLEIKKQTNTDEIDSKIKKVFAYYVKHLFTAEGAPKYYHNKQYPTDIHTIAVSILFFAQLIEDETGLFTAKDRTDASRLMQANVDLAMSQFFDRKGYFYYQKGRFFTNKIPYMRWSQAWMFYALTHYQSIKEKKSVYATVCE